MRAHPDTGSKREFAQLKQIPNRHPWQITRAVNFPAQQSATADITLEPIPGIKDERGLATYALSMKPNAKAIAPDPSHGDGQYLVVVKGSLLHEGRILGTHTRQLHLLRRDRFAPGRIELAVLGRRDPVTQRLLDRAQVPGHRPYPLPLSLIIEVE